ncbi:MAG: type II toxin-antitoxin system HicB family antitoxin [Dehalococcoidia bacterium]
MGSGVFHVIKDGVVYELEREEDGSFVIAVPALPGCISVGETIEEALDMIADAMGGWLQVARDEGFPIPSQFETVARAS